MRQEDAHKAGTRQLSFRDEDATVEYILAAAEFEEIPVADFIRKLCRYGLRQYRKAGSLYALRAKEREADGQPRAPEVSAHDAQVLEKVDAHEAPPAKRRISTRRSISKAS
jgi:hypothetical protein